MRAALVAFVGLFTFAAASVAQPNGQPDKAAFEGMCARVSAADGVPAEAITPFCSCLAGRAAQDAGLYTELWTAAESQPNPEARMEILSTAGQAAVQACRAPPP